MKIPPAPPLEKGGVGGFESYFMRNFLSFGHWSFVFWNLEIVHNGFSNRYTHVGG
jgi:hypothetical protein